MLMLLKHVQLYMFYTGLMSRRAEFETGKMVQVCKWTTFMFIWCMMLRSSNLLCRSCSVRLWWLQSAAPSRWLGRGEGGGGAWGSRLVTWASHWLWARLASPATRGSSPCGQTGRQTRPVLQLGVVQVELLRYFPPAVDIEEVISAPLKVICLL